MGQLAGSCKTSEYNCLIKSSSAVVSQGMWASTPDVFHLSSNVRLKAIANSDQFFFRLTFFHQLDD